MTLHRLLLGALFLLLFLSSHAFSSAERDLEDAKLEEEEEEEEAKEIPKDFEEEKGKGEDQTETERRSQLLEGITLVWMAPFLSGGGYSSEAISFIGALHKKMDVAISQHGDAFSPSFTAGLAPSTYHVLVQLMRKRYDVMRSIVICHSEPGAWALPAPMYQTTQCPSPKAWYAVGRTMFETDRITPGHVRRCNLMDEIWVPTQFHVETFARSGVEREKLHVIPEAVETAEFDPFLFEPLDLHQDLHAHFKFLSVFKWEERKGWDILLKAYFTEFTKEDKVVLILKTNPYHTKVPFQQDILRFVKEEMGYEESQLDQLPKLILMDGYLSFEELPALYKAADCFVLPSRAMSMELPVIATDWSGPQEFLNEENGYPLPLEGMSTILTGPFRGHQWALPSVSHLRRIMRHVLSHPLEASEKGKRARQDMLRKYRPEVVADVILQRVSQIAEMLLKREEEDQRKREEGERPERVEL